MAFSIEGWSWLCPSRPEERQIRSGRRKELANPVGWHRRLDRDGRLPVDPECLGHVNWSYGLIDDGRFDIVQKDDGRGPLLEGKLAF